MAQTKICKITGEQFTIRDEDLEFYDQISPVFDGEKFTIPPPTICPRERERRRLAYRNERKLYRRKSSLSGTPLISFFDENAPYKVFTREEWWSDTWDPLNYGQDFDFSRYFFEQFYELQLAVPRPPLVNNKAENSDYCNFSDGNKNCYLLTTANYNKDSYYGFFVVNCTDAVDCVYCVDSELIYDCADCNKCYNLNSSQNCENCTDSEFLFNCRGVKDCIMCVNLANKEEYFVLNNKCSKGDFEKIRAAIKTHPDYKQQLLTQFANLKYQFPVKALNLRSCENCIGDDLLNSKNIYTGFAVHNSENCAYIQDGLVASNCYDICFFNGAQWCYESTSLMGYGYRFTIYCRDSTDLFYCDNCYSCKNCFGCIGLRGKQYCILNKQYSKEDFDKLSLTIIEHMRKTDEWGEFFPIKYSLFAYNETMACDVFPLTKEEAIKKDYKWKD